MYHFPLISTYIFQIEQQITCIRMLFILTVLVLLSCQRSLTKLQNSVNTSKHQGEAAVENTQVCSQKLNEENILVVNCSEMRLKSLVTPPSVNRQIILDMSKNVIDELKIVENLDSFSNVVVLKLGHNKLVSVADFFEHMDLENIKDIYLNNNFIVEFPVIMMNKDMPKLKLLNLKGNKIHTVTVDNMKQLGVLKTLDLSSNRITKWNFHNVSGNNFDYFIKIESLDLSFNEISELTKSSFGLTKHITELNVSFNGLTQLHERTFFSLQGLRVLDLSNNKLKTLPANVFAKLSSLSYLYMSNNYLLTFPANVPMLNWLDLSFNKIAKIEESLNPVIYPHEVILLGGNPFMCDCKLLWLKEFYDTREYLLKFIDVRKDKFIPVCESPESLKGDTWDVIGDDVFDCDEDIVAFGPVDLTPSDLDSIVQTFGSETDEGIIDFKIVEIRTDSMKLEWIVNSARQVTITYRRFGDKTRKQAALLPVTVTTFILRHLNANTPYIVCVCLTKDVHIDDNDEKCIEIMTKKREDEYVTDDSLVLSQISKIIMINVHIIVPFCILCIILCLYTVYLSMSTKTKEKIS